MGSSPVFTTEEIVAPSKGAPSDSQNCDKAFSGGSHHTTTPNPAGGQPDSVIFPEALNDIPDPLLTQDAREEFAMAQIFDDFMNKINHLPQEPLPPSWTTETLSRRIDSVLNGRLDSSSSTAQDDRFDDLSPLTDLSENSSASTPDETNQQAAFSEVESPTSRTLQALDPNLASLAAPFQNQHGTGKESKSGHPDNKSFNNMDELPYFISVLLSSQPSYCQWILDKNPEGTPNLCGAFLNSKQTVQAHVHWHLESQPLLKKKDRFVCHWSRCDSYRTTSKARFENHFEKEHIQWDLLCVDCGNVLKQKEKEDQHTKKKCEKIKRVNPGLLGESLRKYGMHWQE
ncbi:hypothetical protein BDP27DRAFT_712424 [Rhodocollybia butyracea]|uniref:Uncharacterized protein n=1 Tax=Rhodocollybia butyracea TaxID=206335 RepID=A0A9P5UF85_9AGAR|nr:hypothetical protein BDP27DRAFT_712424 [Rhodocollybia butyracea]